MPRCEAWVTLVIVAVAAARTYVCPREPAVAERGRGLCPGPRRGVPRCAPHEPRALLRRGALPAGQRERARPRATRWRADACNDRRWFAGRGRPCAGRPRARAGSRCSRHGGGRARWSLRRLGGVAEAWPAAAAMGAAAWPHG